MTRRLLAAAFILAAFGAAAPARAAAQLPRLPQPPPAQLLTQFGQPVRPALRFHSGFVVDKGRYEVGVATTGAAVVLEVSQSNGSGTLYLAHGVSTPERLQATFGKFGKVSMRFRESPGKPWVGRPRNCHGRQRLLRRTGVFVGSLRFKGEEGYVSVRLHRAKGAIVTPAPKCSRGRQRHAQGRQRLDSIFDFEPFTVLGALARSGTDTTSFAAFSERNLTLFFASRAETRGRLGIIRYATANRKGAFHPNEEATAANLTPPPPFHGTGRYRAAPDGTATWLGSLRVSFPGAPDIPLAGPEFEPSAEFPF